MTTTEPMGRGNAPGRDRSRPGIRVRCAPWLLLAMLAVGLPPARAQDVSVQDEQSNPLMQVHDEGNSGSLSLPPVTAPPADTTNKLYHRGGALRWRDAQMGIGWTRTGTDLHLTTATDNVGIGVTDPDARLEVAGQVKITGGAPGADKLLVSDAEGLAAWETVHQARATYVGGNFRLQLAATPRLVRQISISVPAAGSVHVSATGYVSWAGRQKDSARFCISASSTADMDPDYLMELTDYGCTDGTDQYASWRVQRGFSVPAAGTYVYYLWADAPLTNNVDPCTAPYDCNTPSTMCCYGNIDDLSQSDLGDVNMFAKYRPAP